MRLFKDTLEAREAMEEREQLYLPRICVHDNDALLCGNWCPAFQVIRKMGGGRNHTYVYLNCFPQKVRIEVEDVSCHPLCKDCRWKSNHDICKDCNGGDKWRPKDGLHNR